MLKNHPKLLIFLGVLALMTVTNPRENQYLTYAAKNLCRQFQEPLKTPCQIVVSTQKENVKEYLEVATNRNNLVVCSFYTTELVGMKVQTIGVLGNFFTLP